MSVPKRLAWLLPGHALAPLLVQSRTFGEVSLLRVRIARFAAATAPASAKPTQTLDPCNQLATSFQGVLQNLLDVSSERGGQHPAGALSRGASSSSQAPPAARATVQTEGDGASISRSGSLGEAPTAAVATLGLAGAGGSVAAGAHVAPAVTDTGAVAVAPGVAEGIQERVARLRAELGRGGQHNSSAGASRGGRGAGGGGGGSERQAQIDPAGRRQGGTGAAADGVLAGGGSSSAGGGFSDSKGAGMGFEAPTLSWRRRRPQPELRPAAAAAAAAVAAAGTVEAGTAAAAAGVAAVGRPDAVGQWQRGASHPGAAGLEASGGEMPTAVTAGVWGDWGGTEPARDAATRGAGPDSSGSPMRPTAAAGAAEAAGEAEAAEAAETAAPASSLRHDFEEGAGADAAGTVVLREAGASYGGDIDAAGGGSSSGGGGGGGALAAADRDAELLRRIAAAASLRDAELLLASWGRWFRRCGHQASACLCVPVEDALRHDLVARGVRMRVVKRGCGCRRLPAVCHAA